MKFRDFSVAKLALTGALIAGLEVCWNLAVGRIPIYLFAPSVPGLALPLNALVHIGVTSALFCLLGALVFLIPLSACRRNYPAVAITVWGMHLALTVLARYQNLQHELPPALALLARIAVVLLVAAGAFSFNRWLLRRRQGGPGWPVILVLSAFGATGIVLLRFPLHTLPGLLPYLSAIWLAHLAAGLLLRRRRPGLAGPAVGIAMLALLASAGRGLWAQGGGGQARPHLVFLVYDAARADRMSLYGYRQPTTPFLDSLSAGSLLFHRAYPTANYTFPSHVSFFTGLYNRTHEIWQGTDLEMERYREFEHLASVLSSRGYRTVLLSENPWIAGLYDGFDYYHYQEIGGMPVSGWQGTWKDLSSTPARFPFFFGNTSSPYAARQFLDLVEFCLQGYYKGVSDDYQLRLLYEQMLLRRRGEPLFFFINWMNVHNRYYPAPGREFGETIKPYDWSGDYDRAMSHIDLRLKEVWDLFARMGELKQTVFVVTSDHGELLGEYRIFGHTRSFFSGVIRVPLILLSPAWAGRQVFEGPVSLVTAKRALEVLSESPPERDLRDQLAEVFAARPVVAEHRSFQPGPDGEYLRGWMLVSGEGMKLIHDPEAPGFRSSWGETTDFLFDLERDPGEEENLYPTRPRTVVRLDELYRSWREETPSAPVLESGRIAPGLKEKLRAMGYFQ